MINEIQINMMGLTMNAAEQVDIRLGVMADVFRQYSVRSMTTMVNLMTKDKDGALVASALTLLATRTGSLVGTIKPTGVIASQARKFLSDCPCVMRNHTLDRDK